MRPQSANVEEAAGLPGFQVWILAEELQLESFSAGQYMTRPITVL